MTGIYLMFELPRVSTAEILDFWGISSPSIIQSCLVWNHSKNILLVKESNNLASNMLSPGFLVVHNASTGGEDNVSELTRRQKLDNPLLEITELNVVARRDDTSLVETAVELNDNLSAAVIVDFLEFANVACPKPVSARSRRRDFEMLRSNKHIANMGRRKEMCKIDRKK